MELPPPNIYSPKFDRVKQAAPATSLGYGSRSSMNKTFTAPGPGNYMVKSYIGEGPKFGMRVKLNDSLQEKLAKELPSPVAYDPNFEVVKKRLGVFSVGKSQRKDLAKKEAIPGPG